MYPVPTPGLHCVAVSCKLAEQMLVISVSISKMYKKSRSNPRVLVLHALP